MYWPRVSQGSSLTRTVNLPVLSLIDLQAGISPKSRHFPPQDKTVSCQFEETTLSISRGLSIIVRSVSHGFPAPMRTSWVGKAGFIFCAFVGGRPTVHSSSPFLLSPPKDGERGFFQYNHSNFICNWVRESGTLGAQHTAVALLSLPE